MPSEDHFICALCFLTINFKGPLPLTPGGILHIVLVLLAQVSLQLLSTKEIWLAFVVFSEMP